MRPGTRAPVAWSNRRTRQSTVTFHRRFTLNRDVGELPPGSYDIESDEEEIQAVDRTACRQVAIYFYVQNAASTRMVVLTPAELKCALERDLEGVSGSDDATAN
jgi:hypothetical protein